MKRPTPFQVQKCLGGLQYPAAKQEVLERARVRGADGAVLHLLDRIDDRPYESPIALSREVGRQSERLCD